MKRCPGLALLLVLGLLASTSLATEPVKRKHDVTLSDGQDIEVMVQPDTSQAAATWLLGSWRMRHDPDGSKPDTLVFNADGTGLVIRPDGGLFPYGFRVEENKVMLVISVNGNTGEFPMHISHDRTRLSNDTGAWYTPLETE